jgi:hypothetical protein
MASNNYTSANITPSADTFREWVDLTNRITYDMEKVVVTVAANTQGARTSGNASVNGYFSANTLIVEHELTGATATGSNYGTKAPKADLIIVSNTILKANGSSTGSILFAQSNAYFSGANVVFSSNVSVNSTSAVFSSNAALNVFNTPMDINANMDVDNALTQVTSTNTVIEGGNTNITSNVNIDAASIDINDGVLHAGATSINIDSTAVTFTSNAGTNIFNTPVDINANIDVDNALTDITSANLAVTGLEMNVDANTVFTANVNITSDSDDFNINSDVVLFTSDVTSVTSNAGTSVFNSPLDINDSVDIDNGLTQITSTNTVIESGNVNISSNILSTALASFTGANVYSTAANNALLSNVNIGQGASDFLRSDATVVFNETLNVVKAVDLDATLNVDGATTLNGAVTLGNATGDDLTFTGYSASGITPKTNGNLSLGTSSLRWDGVFDDLRADDLTVDDDAGIAGNLTVNGTGTVDLDFTVNTALSVAMSGGVRTTTVGAGTTVSDQMIIKSRVGSSTFGLMPSSSTVKLGNTTNRWIVSGTTGNFNSNMTIAGNLDVDGTANLDVVDIDGAVDMATTLEVHGGVTLGDTLSVTGVSTQGIINASGLASLDGGIDVGGHMTVADTDGDIVTNGSVGSASMSTTAGGAIGTTLSVGSTLGVTGAATLSDQLSVAELSAFAKNVTVGGTLVVTGASTLGAAATDQIVLNGKINSNIIPQTSGNDLGSSTLRWETFSTTVNTTGDITAGGDIDVTGEANTSTLVVRSTSGFQGNSTWSRTGTAGNLTITANTVQHNMGVGGIVCANLVVSGTATLPSDTSLTLDTIGAKTINVADVINLGTGANANPQVIFGSGAGSGSKANVIFTDAEFSTTFTPRVDNTIDIGTTGKGFRTGYFDTSVVVGDTVANTTAVVADNIYATNDLIGNYSSDQRLKDNVLVIDSALTKVNEIGGYSFTWNNKIDDFREGTNDYGVIAQEIENILPDAVSINSQGNKTVNYNALIPLLVEAVKELSAKVDYYMQADIEGDEE